MDAWQYRLHPDSRQSRSPVEARHASDDQRCWTALVLIGDERRRGGIHIWDAAYVPLLPMEDLHRTVHGGPTAVRSDGSAVVTPWSNGARYDILRRRPFQAG